MKRQAGKRDLYADLIPLTVPEVRRLVLAMTEPEEKRDFRLGWSLWRQATGAAAARCRAARRALRRASLPDAGT
jgi:hypothetical protein